MPKAIRTIATPTEVMEAREGRVSIGILYKNIREHREQCHIDRYVFSCRSCSFFSLSLLNN